MSGWNYRPRGFRPSYGEYAAYGTSAMQGLRLAARGYRDASTVSRAVRRAPARVKGRPRRKAKKGPKKSTFKLTKDVSRIKRSMKVMKQHDDATTGTLTYRDVTSFRLLSALNEQAVASYSGSKTSSMETALANLKFFDPANPATLITANGTSGTYQRNYLFDSISSKLVVRNNYQSDVKVKIYLCKPKDDTSQTPFDAWNSAIADGGNAADINQINQFPTDYDLLNDLWSLKVVSNTVLSPGQTATSSHTEKNVEYDPATVDTHSLIFQKEYKSFEWLVVIEGTLSHDVAADDQGLAPCGIDILSYKTIKVKYSAGVNIKYIVLAQVLDVPATTFIQSHQPIPDNISYSVG